MYPSTIIAGNHISFQFHGEDQTGNSILKVTLYLKISLKIEWNRGLKMSILPIINLEYINICGYLIVNVIKLMLFNSYLIIYWIVYLFKSIFISF